MKRFLLGFVTALALVVAPTVVAQMGSQPSRVPTSIGAIGCQLIDPDGTTPAMRAQCQVQVLDANGEVMASPTYDVRSVGSATVKTEAVSFLNAVRAQAEAEIIP